MTFSDLNLIPPLLKAALDAGYETPSPIQEQAIPPVLAGRDLLGCAQTGTGKTAAFAMPILQRLFTSPACGTGKRPIRALILTPTRELALQIDESFAAYGKYVKLRPCVIFGGVNQNPQVAKLKAGVDILTATPGRLNDLIQQGFIHLQDVEVFVLDEADRMLDMGFVQDVKRIIRQLPAKRQTLLFSATMPKEIENLADSLLHDPAKVMVAPPATTVEAIEQSLYFVDKGNKRCLLANLLHGVDVVNALVFTRTKHGADRVVRELAQAGIEAMAIHGNKSQNARQDALGRFKDGRIRVLVATDIAARGIDVSGLSHVFNYDLPNIPETYVHRIGRTGRAGQEGVAVSFCDFEEKAYLADIEKLIGIHVPVVTRHDWPMKIFEIPPKVTQQRGSRNGSAQGRAPRAAAPAKEAAPRGRTSHGAQPHGSDGQRRPAAQSHGSAGQRRPTNSKYKKREGVPMENSEAPRAAVQTAPVPQTSAPAPQPAQGASMGEGKQVRRRRGGRRNKNKTNGAEQGQQGQSTQAMQSTQQSQQGPYRESAQEYRAPRPNNRNDRTQGTSSAAPQNAAQRQAAPNGLGLSGVSRSARPSPALSDKDDSIQVISRKAVVTKFTNFEEYMKAHGDTAPAADGSTEQD